ncbi:MAG: endonuclease/exonuclease/phosphatase family protein [Clostridia bacterium]|nr:endonuclease/exonuclease/phosphatase family protein [Clostridia bacterium]
MIFAFRQLMALILSALFTAGVFNPANLTIRNIPEKAEEATRIVSFNVRYKDDDYGSVEGRSKLICAALEQYAPDSFGVQEATQQWLDIFAENLADYACVSQLRDDTEGAEANAVYYLKDKYTLLDSGTIWLSDTPDVFGSKYEDSGCARIATWATLKSNSTGKVYTHINTHLDFQYETVQAAQIKVLKAKIEELKAQGYPVVCTGDFNSQEDSAAYNDMIDFMNDTKYLAKKSDKGATYKDYGLNAFATKPIDFIFVSEGVEVDTYKIIDERIKMMYLSDHAGLCADVRF